MKIWDLRVGWSDGTRATYSNWDIGQPSVNTQGKCVTLNTRTGKWTDIDCLTHRLGFICTYKENSDTDMVPDEKTNNTNSQTAALVLGVQIVSVCVILIAVILFITLRKSRKTSHSAANKNSFPTIVYLPKQECDGVRT
ncbi:hypothetical protein Btru_061244 [Bulinus truncatus]|nr:hypothetical protein Btru_061244 [Bulinus truncatus]